MRVKGGTVTHRRHKKVLDAAKGYYDPLALDPADQRWCARD